MKITPVLACIFVAKQTKIMTKYN